MKKGRRLFRRRRPLIDVSALLRVKCVLGSLHATRLIKHDERLTLAQLGGVPMKRATHQLNYLAATHCATRTMRVINRCSGSDRQAVCFIGHPRLDNNLCGVSQTLIPCSRIEDVILSCVASRSGNWDEC